MFLEKWALKDVVWYPFFYFYFLNKKDNNFDWGKKWKNTRTYKKPSPQKRRPIKGKGFNFTK